MLAIGVSVIIQAVLCIQTSTQRNTCCISHSQHYAVIDGNDTTTNPTSTRVSPPSYTTFTVPYTGGFTDSTDRDSESAETMH